MKTGEITDVDLKFTDLRGVWQHMTLTTREFTMDSVKKGIGFDGSSIKGFMDIHESDMLLKPDLTTMFVDPFFPKTISVICDIFNPDTGVNFEKDPRLVAQKAEEYLKKSKIGDTSYWGPELEFFVFDYLDYHIGPYNSGIMIGQSEIDEEEGDGYKILPKSGYFPVPPFDKLQIFRSEMVAILESLGIFVEVHHHEVAAGGQVEIDLRYDTLLRMADKVMIYKYVARNLAKKYGMTVCFLPKPIYGDNGSGMHTHQSIFKNGKNIFFDPKGYGELSKDALSYTAGLLSHIEAILGITNPTVNSYRRLVPHFEAPTSIAFSKRNRSAAIRTPMYFRNEEKSKRIEFRCPDPTCNPYLSFAVQLVSGLQGIKEKLDPKKLGFGPFDENIWEKKDVRQTPTSLFETLAALKYDKTFAESGVFDQSIINSYIDVKMTEARTNLMYPTPADYWFYADI
jgi:glutamine synthetase